MADRVYAPFSAKEHTFADGGKIIKLSAKADKLIAFIEANFNESGYINLVLASRREKGQYGDTHTVYLDTWKPKQRDGATTNTPETTDTKPKEDLPF